jgi:predicted dehydrogenase
MATLADNGIDDQTSMIFSYPSGATATLHTTIKSATGIRAVIAGTKGRIEVERSFYAPSSFTIYGNDGSERTFHPYPFEDGYVGLGEQAIEVARCLESGLIESPMRPLAATLEVMELMDAVRERIGLIYPGEVSHSH